MTKAIISLPAVGLTVDPEFILRHCYPQPDDIVVVCGTLIEGIGNACSDIDVYVITQSYRSSRDIDVARHHRVIDRDRNIVRCDLPASDVWLIHTVLPDTKIKVDVEFKTHDEVDDLIGRIADIFDYASKNLILLTKRLLDREEIFIHRLFHCIPLANGDRMERLRSRIPRDRYSYIAYRWVASDFAVLLDLAGAWGAGDLDRAVEIARENVFTQTAAYLRLRGVTNLRRKWILTYLQKFADLSALRDRFLDLMYLREADGGAGKSAYVLTSLDYVDHVFELSRPLLAAMPAVPSGPRAIALLSLDRKEGALTNPYADWEFAYRLKAYDAAGAPTRAYLSMAAVQASPRAVPASADLIQDTKAEA